MGNILIWLILLVTIPRWAMTLQQVDRYTVLGIPVAAIGEGIVLELGCLYIIQVFGAAKALALEYRAKWEVHAQMMEEQGKHNRKPENDPRLTGYKVLMVAFSALLLLTLAAQTPFIMAQFLPDETMADLLSRRVLWGYSFVLVISPEVMTAAIALALHYHGVVQQIDGKEPFSAIAVAAVKEKVAALQSVSQQKLQQVEQKLQPVAAPTASMPTKRHFDAWIASHNGTGASLTRQDALRWAIDAGVDVNTVTGKRNRDKVLRWWRGYVQQLQQPAQPPQQEQEE